MSDQSSRASGAFVTRAAYPDRVRRALRPVDPDSTVLRPLLEVEQLASTVRPGPPAVTSGEPDTLRSADMAHTRIVTLDHITVDVRDLKAARRFYGAALGAIGM